MPVDYQLSKIYKIEPLNADHESDVYIGSTYEPSLAHRMAGHRRNYKSWKKGNGGHVRSFDLFNKYDIDNCQILLVESYPCLNKDELRQREGYYISNIPCVNKYVAGRTKKDYIKQYRNNHKEHLKETKKKYYENNREAISNKHKQYRDDHKESQKQYRDDHKEHIKELKKQYYIKNKEYSQTKFKCICGGCYTRRHKSEHLKSLKHINYMTKHDDLMEKVNEIITLIKNDNLI
jgi:hypothetical protein